MKPIVVKLFTRRRCHESQGRPVEGDPEGDPADDSADGSGSERRNTEKGPRVMTAHEKTLINASISHWRTRRKHDGARPQASSGVVVEKQETADAAQRQ